MTKTKSTRIRRPAPSRGPLRPMGSSNSFRDYVLDQLSAIRDVRARAMFGGVGVYAGDTFFALIASDVLYLKTDDTNRAQFESAGSLPFRPYDDKPMTMPYYNVPVDVLESADSLVAWAKVSIKIAAAGKAAKATKTKAAKRSKR